MNDSCCLPYLIFIIRISPPLFRFQDIRRGSSRHADDENLIRVYKQSKEIREKEWTICRILEDINPLSSSRNSMSETQGEKPEGSMAAPMIRATLEPSGFFPCVSEM
jgi:hypothetical protein